MTLSLYNHMGISGGKDSTALLLWAVYESGYSAESLLPVWCDTGNEHEYTALYVKWLSENVCPVTTIKPELNFYQLAHKNKGFPSARRRFCTEALKVDPSEMFMRDLLEKGIDVRLHTGVRAAESRDRAQLPERDWDNKFDCEMYRPLLTWTLDDVWAIHKKYGVPSNPLYGIEEFLPWNKEQNPYFGEGVGRVGCWPCVMSAKFEIGIMARKHPERIDFIRQNEESIINPAGYASFFSYDKVPLSQRSKEITTKKGEDMKICTIDDVARWSQTSRGGQQYVLNLPMTTELIDEAPSCSSRYGLCE